MVPRTMKCLSVRPPWSHLIVTGAKDVENRTWYCPYRGPLLIHASKTIEEVDLDHLRLQGYDFSDMAVGAIVGMVTMVGCTRDVKSEWHMSGQYGFYVENAFEFRKPIPCRGRLGIFDVDVTQALHVELVDCGAFV